MGGLPVPRVLLICTANVCRSPLAQGLLKKQLADQGLGEEWEVGSVGNWTEGGVPVDPRVVEILAERGIKAGEQRSREVTEELLAEADLVLTMEAGHQEALQVEFPEQADKVYMLSELVGERKNVVDPVGDEEGKYNEVMGVIEGYLEGAVEKMKRLMVG